MSSFADDLKALRNFFVRLEVHAEELRYRGLGAVKQWAEFESMLELLPTIEKKMSAALKTARFVVETFIIDCLKSPIQDI